MAKFDPKDSKCLKILQHFNAKVYLCFYENILKCFPKYLAPNVSFEEYDEFPFRGLLEQGMAFVNFLLVWIFPLERQGVENYFGLSELILREFLPFAMRLFHEKFY